MTTERRDAAWMFEDYPAGTFLRESQLLSTSFTRLTAVILRPFRRLIRRATAHA